MKRRTDLEEQDNIYRYCPRCSTSGKPVIMQEIGGTVVFYCVNCENKLKIVKGNINTLIGYR